LRSRTPKPERDATADGEMRWTGVLGEKERKRIEDRGRRGDEETRRRGLHVLLLTGDEGKSEATHRRRRRQGLAEERGEVVRRRRGGDWD
jgi:hypothetical protein